MARKLELDPWILHLPPEPQLAGHLPNECYICWWPWLCKLNLHTITPIFEIQPLLVLDMYTFEANPLSLVISQILLSYKSSGAVTAHKSPALIITVHITHMHFQVARLVERHNFSVIFEASGALEPWKHQDWSRNVNLWEGHFAVPEPWLESIHLQIGPNLNVLQPHDILHSQNSEAGKMWSKNWTFLKL